MTSLAALTRDLLRAIWIAATNSTRDPLCRDCRCPLREGHDHG